MIAGTIVYGPPGTGKSTYLINRIQHFLDSGIQPSKIGVVSFTRAAARELVKRTGAMWGSNNNIGTLHSYAFRAIGCTREQVVDRHKLREFSKLVQIDITGADSYDDERKGTGDVYLFVHGLQRATLAQSTIERFISISPVGSYAEYMYFVEAYQRWKQENGYIDFEDMIHQAYDVPGPDLEVLFIDEAQDLSQSQWRLIDKWAMSIPTMILALDDDQTLYKFSGADPAGGPRFEQRHNLQRVILASSHRVPSVIHGLANRIINRITERVQKTYVPAREGGEIRQFGSWDSVPMPEPSDDVLILYRNHDLRKQVEDWLVEGYVPFITENGRPGPLQNKIAKAIVAWFNAQRSHAATGSVILKDSEWRDLSWMVRPVYKQAITDRDLEPLIQHGWVDILRLSLTEIRYYSMLQDKYGHLIPATRIRLSTIHGAKGWEADRVIVFDSMSGATIQGFSKDPDTETRCFYVAVTRSRNLLDVVMGDNEFGILNSHD